MAPGADGFADFMVRLAAAEGDRIDIEPAPGGAVLRRTGWRLMDGVADAHPALLDIWSCVHQGALAAHDPRLELRRDGMSWRVQPAEGRTP
jgi:hypothetical protein